MQKNSTTTKIYIYTVYKKIAIKSCNLKERKYVEKIK